MFATWAIGVVGPLLFGKALSCKYVVEVNQKPFLEFDLSGLNRYGQTLTHSVCLSVYVCMYVHCVYVCILYVYVCVCVYACVFECVFECTCLSVWVHVYAPSIATWRSTCA